jgi:hypothetical protein
MNLSIRTELLGEVIVDLSIFGVEQQAIHRGSVSYSSRIELRDSTRLGTSTKGRISLHVLNGGNNTCFLSSLHSTICTFYYEYILCRL